jgi:WD40 repeat protein
MTIPSSCGIFPAAYQSDWHTLEGPQRRVTAVAISPDGKTAVSGSDDKTLKLWDLSSGKALQIPLKGHNRVTAVAISPDGKTAVSGLDNTLKLWDLSSGKALHTLEGHSDAGHCGGDQPGWQDRRIRLKGQDPQAVGSFQRQSAA